MQIITGKTSSVIILPKGTTLLIENFHIFTKKFQEQKFRSPGHVKLNLRKNTISSSNLSEVNFEEFLLEENSIEFVQKHFPYICNIQIREEE
jgi:hypothetical protein